MRLIKHSSFAVALVFAASCGDSTAPVTPDLAVPIIVKDLSAPGCTSNAGCAAPTAKCDVKSGLCVACLADTDCGLGQLCSAGACVAGCSVSHGCGDAGVCDNDAGICRSCMVDGDCGDPANPRCDAADRRCVPCLPTNDNCGGGKYCAVTNGVYACTAGCADDSACQGADGGVPTMACCAHVCINTASDDANCKTCGNACGNTSTCCNQACVDVSTDANNCGACGQSCMLPGGALPACVAAKCMIAKCPDGFANCDGNPKSGCNVNLNTDVNNCLGCSNSCVAAHAVAACNMGCVISMCNNGFGDCDNNFANGCEVDLTSTLANCGKCGNACPMVANGTAGCVNSACAIASCSGSFADCNMLAVDGCEVDTSVDVMNCGGCKNVCPVIGNGTPGCAMGVCGIGACTMPFKDCDMNPNNGCEVNTSNDVSNCGACAKVCAGVPNGIAGCAAGACTIASCNANFKDCNGNLNDGCEVSISNDIMNCGSCGHVCPLVMNGSPICTNGVCGVTGCNLPFKDCDGNPANGCEANTNTDIVNCGLCGDVCPAVANATIGCNTGHCGIGVCNMGFKDCDMNAGNGCEINTTNDVNNCNACSAKCVVANAVPACVASACVIGSCNAGFGDCNHNAQDGCEDATSSDVNNCGACAKVCAGVANGTPACSNSVCGVGSCTAPFKDCNGLPGDGCEDNTNTDNNNCGACGTKCANGMTCQAGKCAGFTCAPVCLAGTNCIATNVCGTPVHAAGTFGPIHSFAGATSNFFISTGQGNCSVNDAQIAAQDAAYFCTHFYGPNCTVQNGYVQAAGAGNEMHKNSGCTSTGTDIPNTVCDLPAAPGMACKMWIGANGGYGGLTNLVCVCM